MRTRLTFSALILLFWLTSSFAAPPAFTPDPASVQRCGPAYRYPQAGWIVLHIEGEPYERGFQHGQLLAPEIADYIKTLATARSPKAPVDGWQAQRLLVDALFLRRYEREFLEEMKGIAEGAAAAGAKWDGRPLDLLDIVGINSGIEIDFLDNNLAATPIGLEGRVFMPPAYAKPLKTPPANAGGSPEPHRREPSPPSSPPMHCSAFAATGPATADGKIVFGHITMWSLVHVRHFNIWLDVKPTQGRRVLMQTFPGGIMSGMDYYFNDAGILVAETTIAQTKFDINGTSMVSRIRQALQYSDTIDQAVKLLGTNSNGVYSNEWLLADVKTNEIAMYELGTHKSKLWRSSKNEWLAGTEGFYWGCNNAKDLDVRLETIPSVHGRPANMVFRPSPRDIKWIELYQQHKGKINADFGVLAFTTPPLAAFPSCDAKFTTSDMAKRLETWALFGPPLGRSWQPTDEEREKYPGLKPLVSNDWAILAPESKATTDVIARSTSKGTPVAVDLGFRKRNRSDDDADPDPLGELPPAWHGTLLPKTDGDIWLAAGFADYERIFALEKALKARAKDGKLSETDQERLELAQYEPMLRFRMARRRLGQEFSPDKTAFDWKDNAWYDLVAAKGVLMFAELRKLMGDEAFAKSLDEFGRANAGKAVTTVEFRDHVGKTDFRGLPDFLVRWFHGTEASLEEGQAGALSDTRQQKAWAARFDKDVWAVTGFEAEPEKTLIIYDTLKDVYAQREAAELLQEKLRRRTGNYTVPIRAMREVTEEQLKNNHLLLIGRPDSNAVLAKCAAELPLKFGPASFVLKDKTYANPASAVIAAGTNPHNPRYSIVAFSGLSAEATRSSVERLSNRGGQLAPVILLAAGEAARPMVVQMRSPTPEAATKAAK
jgi:hypothetical protein